jgi:DNA replication initiation complex subunit (GINS family)
MITYDDLYEAFRKEKYSDQLQVLPKKFLEDVAAYLKEKKEFVSKEDDLFSDMSMKNKKMLENAIASFRGLIRLRKKKILALAFVASEVGISKKDFENLMAFERELFEESVKSLEKAEKNLGDLMSGVSSEGDSKKHQLVRFLEDVPEFLNMEGESAGPFEKGEVANLEKEIVNILEKDKRVEILEEE